ncbi:unnamed protein product [Adineta steineri]|uniref:Uncharacterized protein n=1 Tax=Adineta steineri TaxID=433720 RepID=A0A818PDW7_9BILA|nr:unnamed protein product [Adineta steineri]
MKQTSSIISRQNIFIFVITILLFIFPVVQWSRNETSRINKASFASSYSSSYVVNKSEILSYRRSSCTCTRPLPKSNSNLLIIDESSSSLCSHYSTLRGSHQRIVSISMYGQGDNAMFTLNTSVNLLHELVSDIKKRYPNWILRIYHDLTIKNDVICSIECTYNNVDFCNTTSLSNLGNLNSYIPPKIWRFLPVGDELVDIMISRDLDSPITQRELDAVKEWILSGKAWHSMRDNPMHFVVMLGGMWGFRPALNRTMGNYVLQKILNRSLIINFGGRGDQGFLSEHVWPHIQDHIIVHDSFLCTEPYGKNSRPWPTRRQHPSNNTYCFVGCTRPCCDPTKYPFNECPKACRPQNHTDWTMC